MNESHDNTTSLPPSPQPSPAGGEGADPQLDTALIASEYGELIDQAVARIKASLQATEEQARATAVEIIDLGLALMADFAGTAEYERAKDLIEARIETKLATLGVDTHNRGRQAIREFVMGLLVGARAIVVGRIAP